MDQLSINFGIRLREAREARQLSLRDIADSTKISVASLAAMERSDFARLPGGVFRTGFVKAFAAEVGLDPNKLASEYRAIFEPQPPVAAPEPRESWAGRFDLSHRWPVVVAAIAAIVIAAASFMLQADDAVAESADALPAPTEVQRPERPPAIEDAPGAGSFA